VAVALQSGNHRRGTLPQRAGGFADDAVRVKVGCRSRQAGQVVTGGKRLAAGTAKNDSARALPVGLQRRSEGREQLRVQRVAALRAVEGERKHVARPPLAEERVSQVRRGMS